jgi:hypothetical protein
MYKKIYDNVLKELVKKKYILKILGNGFDHLGDFILNKNNTKSLISIRFLDKYSSNTLKKYINFTYCIVKNNNTILKIGYTTQALKEFAGYGIGNGGKPSISRTGIHYIIANELYNKNKISFYYQECPKIKSNFIYKNIFGEENILYNQVYVNPKIIEKKHIEKYRDVFGTIPKYNRQENGRSSDWCKTLFNIHISICTKKIIEYSDDKDYNDFIKLYHWKHNNIHLVSK